jgi:hypothetical protein
MTPRRCVTHESAPDVLSRAAGSSAVSRYLSTMLPSVGIVEREGGKKHAAVYFA